MQINETPVTIESPETSVTVPSEPTQKRFPLKKPFLICIAIVLLGLAVAVGYWYGLKAESNQSATSSLLQKSDNTPVDAEGGIQNPGEDMSTFLYVSDFGLYAHSKKSEGADIQRVSNENHDVSKYAFHRQTQQIAYSWGEAVVNENDYPVLYEHTVTLTNLKNNELTDVLTIPIEVDPNNQDRISRVSDLDFSDDGQLLAIMTTDAMYVYTLETKELEKVYSNRVQEAEQWLLKNANVYAYSRPQFSPDKSKLLFTENYYEGGNYGIFDLKTKQYSLIPDSFNYTTSVLGWEDSNSLIIAKQSETELGKSHILLYSLDSKTTSQIAMLPGSVQFTEKVGANYYFNTFEFIENADLAKSISKNRAIKLDTSNDNEIEVLLELEREAASTGKTIHPETFLPYAEDSIIVGAIEIEVEDGRVLNNTPVIYQYYPERSEWIPLVKNAKL